jgi:hypothetical protein
MFLLSSAGFGIKNFQTAFSLTYFSISVKSLSLIGWRAKGNQMANDNLNITIKFQTIITCAFNRLAI